jgi:nicotinate-nucleotide adenylyltransferase
MTAQRVGLLGGAFDPPHEAHVALAERAIQVLRLQQLLVLPTGQPWHRAQAPTPAVHRAAMCRLAFRGLDQVLVDEREIHRSGPTYTIDTVLELKAERPDAEWFLIMGADQARKIQSWHRWEELLCMVHIVVADRDPAQGQWQNTALSQATVLPWAPREISATQIRDHLSHQRPVPWLDAKVMGYIQQHQLYS